ncbi:MAG: riboflavin synthase [Acidimicrobiales bacterium]|nr:riboflavin synthase [Acidimicrobiales bacterium]
MFTGIVEELGSITSIDHHGDGARIVVAASTVLSDATRGASIAVNGCCLTLVEQGAGWWATDAVPETLDRTNIGELQVGSPVNLERPLAGDGRFGGHIVQGHIDGVTTVMAIADQADGSRRFTFATPPHLAHYIVEKGSVALDGISLTVASDDDSSFDIAVIPHTLAVTTLGARQVGDTVNIETDILGKHIEKLLQSGRIEAPSTTTSTEQS